MTAARRSRVLLAALVLTLAGCAWLALRTDDAVVDAVRVRQPSAVRAPAATAPARLTAAAPAAWPDQALRTDAANAWPPLGDGARAGWSAPPAPRAISTATAATAALAAEAPPPPPRFPLAYIGRWDGGTAAGGLLLLGGPQRTYAVGVGDVVEGQWRIERVSTDSFSVTFLPQGSVQTVSIRPS